MLPERRVALAERASIAVMWVTAIWAISVAGKQSLLWLFPVLVASGFWVGLTVGARSPAHHPRTQSIRIYMGYFMAWVAAALASLVLVWTIARLNEVASAWATSGSRATGLIIASGLVLFGNALPALPSPGFVAQDAGARQRVRRHTGWILVVTGLAIGASSIILEHAVASQLTNRLLALCFLFVCGRLIASLLDRSVVRSPAT